MKATIILMLCFLAILFTGGVGLIPIIAVWTITYITQLHHGAAKYTPDGKPNPPPRRSSAACTTEATSGRHLERHL